MSEIELKVRVDSKRSYNQSSSWGAFSLTPLNNGDKIETLNTKYNNFMVTGVVQELLEGKEYDIVIEPTMHPKYGKGYGFVRVKYNKPTSVQEQQSYIKVMLNEKQAETILTKYPNHLILDMMKDGTFSYDGMKGIKEATYQKIKKYLLANIDIQEALVELQDLNITFAAMKRLIDHFGSPEMVVQKVTNNIYELCNVSQFGFLKVDAYAMNRGDDKENVNRIKSAIKYILEQEEQSGHSWMSKRSLVDTVQDILTIDKSHIVNLLEEIESKKQGDIFIYNDQVALYRNYRYEKEIRDKLYSLQNAKNGIVVTDVDTKIKEIESKNGFEYTDEQKRAIKLAAENNVFILNGKAGTGKTTSLKGILGVLDQYSHVCCALSGKASKLMSAQGLNGMTAHRMLGVNPNGGFIHNEENPLKYPIIVIDEMSMLSNHLAYNILCAAKEGTKVIILGDNGQLSPIGCGAIFDDLLKAKKFPQQELTIIQRQAAKSGILSSANQVRDGKQIIGQGQYEKEVFGELRDFHVYPFEFKSEILQHVLDICKLFKGKDVSDFQVITGLKSKGDLSVKNLNIELQKIFNDVRKKGIKKGSYTFLKGDKIIHNGNNYEAGRDGETSIFNGTLGKILNIDFAKTNNDKDKLYIEFEGIDEIIEYTSDQIGMIELAYAISCHRSQGSTIKNVLFTFDYGSYMLLSKQFIYTGITRASKACVMVCENRALRHAIKTDHGGMRRTFLYDLLMKEMIEEDDKQI
jgi:exodeoxyribonuclease V alpha subunit